jgi:hypothetical protein
MAKVLLHSVAAEDPKNDPWMRSALEMLTESARQDRFGAHTLTQDPEEADLIVFAEMGLHGIFAELVRHHPYVKKYRSKCFLFDSGDYAVPLLPGVYASLRKQYFDPARTRTGYYLRTDENPYMDFRPLDADPPYLGCFVGSVESDPVRATLAQLPGDRFLVEDTSAFAFQLLSSKSLDERRHQFWSHYADSMASAAFALCPRGRGPGSVRLFEAMRMGRCPVILADEWAYPERVDWQACSIVVPEKDASRLPEILEKWRPQAAEMGARARQEWEKFYAPDVRFHWLVEDCLAMRRARRMPEPIAAKLAWLHLLDYITFRRFLSSKKQMYHRTGRIIL